MSHAPTVGSDAQHEPTPPGSERPRSARHRDRDSWIGAPEFFSLAHACLIVKESFDEMCYLVGSATERRDFRDVDVRMIIDEAKWRALFGTVDNGEIVPFWSLLCTAISEYLSRRTGLRVDFQIQNRNKVKKEDWDRKRVPLCVYPSNIGPPWRDATDFPGNQ